jgi:UDP-glucose 4-epimerase
MIVGVIGANGFVGQNLCKRLIRNDYSVYGIYHTDSSNIPSEITTLDLSEAQRIFFDALFICIGSHAATEAQFLKQIETLNYISKNLRFTRVIFISSIAVYSGDSSMINEGTPCNPGTLYGKYKLIQENIVAKHFGYNIIVRPTYLYGIGMSPNSIIPVWIKKALLERKIVVYGEGTRCQDYLHVDDFCHFCCRILQEPLQGVLIAASGYSISNRTLAENVASKIKGTQIVFQYNDNTPSYYFDIGTAKKLLNWKPEKHFSQEIENLIQHEIACL